MYQLSRNGQPFMHHFEELLKDNLVNTRSFNIVFEHLFKKGGYQAAEEAEKYLQEMERVGCTPDADTSKYALPLLLLNRRMDDAVSLYEHARLAGMESTEMANLIVQKMDHFNTAYPFILHIQWLSG